MEKLKKSTSEKTYDFLFYKTKTFHILDIDLSPNGRFTIFRYLGQALFASLFFGIFIYLFNTNNTEPWIIVASIGSSIFIIFGAPGLPTARPRAVLGGQLIGICSGLLGFYLKLLKGWITMQ